MTFKHKNYFLSVLLLIVLDQLTKFWAYKTLEFMPKEVSDFLSFTFVQNYGAAFGILANQGGYQRYFLTGISVIASIAIIVWIFKTPVAQRITLAALALVLSGAIGNMIDRIYQGFVIDFIDFHYAGWHFPIFNVADICISMGALLLITEFKKL